MTNTNSLSVDATVAFVAGLLSFLSPCLLPLIPAYLAFITGLSLEEIQKRKRFKKIFSSSLLFILGFTLAFTAMGASASFIGSFLSQYRLLLNKIFGVIIILAGLFILRIIKMPFLYKEKRFHLSSKPVRSLGIISVGMAFAFGWTPCVGPILGSILLYAANSETVEKGIFLLFFYSLGIGVPFLATALFYSAFLNLFRGIKKHIKVVEIISGLLLITLGILLFTNKLSYISSEAIKFFSKLGWKPR